MAQLLDFSCLGASTEAYEQNSCFDSEEGYSLAQQHGLPLTKNDVATAAVQCSAWQQQNQCRALIRHHPQREPVTG